MSKAHDGCCQSDSGSCSTHTIQNAKDQVLAAIEQDYKIIFADDNQAMTQNERCRVAWFLCVLANSFDLAKKYLSQVRGEDLSQTDLDAAIDNRVVDIKQPRLKVLFSFARDHVGQTDLPVSAKELEALVAIGLSGQDVVKLKRLVHFIDKQIQVEASIEALQEESA